MNILKISFLLRWLCLVVIAVALVDCADSPAKLGPRASENKKNMAGLKPGMTTEEVTKLMGPPDETMTYRGKNNEAVLTYLYITQYTETYISRGLDKNNFTPFIFVNDRLSGWGWNHLNNAARRYGVDIEMTPFLAPSP